jgi:heme/copper-type cytochrome/quinol oxidase subunit 3
MMNSHTVLLSDVNSGFQIFLLLEFDAFRELFVAWESARLRNYPLVWTPVTRIHFSLLHWITGKVVVQIPQMVQPGVYSDPPFLQVPHRTEPLGRLTAIEDTLHFTHVTIAIILFGLNLSKCDKTTATPKSMCEERTLLLPRAYCHTRSFSSTATRRRSL